MRDLIRNYKMIIRGKSQDTDSEYEPLMSSSSSSQSFGTMREPRIFNQESYSTESDEEPSPVKSVPASPFSIQKQSKSHLLYPHPPSFATRNEGNLFTNKDNAYDKFSPYSKIGRSYSEDPSLLTTEKEIMSSLMDDHSYESFHGFAEENDQPTHNSVVTIFAIWNTTMGSSLLAMSWGLEKTGLFPGILINIIIAALCLYTAYVLLNVNDKHGILGQNVEVPDLCRLLLGRWAEMLAKVFSLVVLIGANIVYWILMSNFLYNSVHFLYGFLTESDNQTQVSSVICPKQIILNVNETNMESLPYVTNSTFENVWKLYSTVPIFLAVIMFPLLNFKSPTFFTKFNSLGTLSVGYLLIFVAVKSFNWGVNMQSWTAEFYLQPTFCALSGMLSLSYFIHNIIISIMRHNKRQEHNGRDLSIAFGLITFTYLFIGVVFYVAFPLVKACIEDNILNNFSKRDPLTLMARVLLLFQLFTVFPLLTFMLRNDITVNLNMIWKTYNLGEFSYGRVVVINFIVLLICIMFACFLPKIGTLIRYTGALSGLVYIFLLPSLLQIASLRKEGRLTVTKLIFHILIVIMGILNLISQFFINDK